MRAIRTGGRSMKTFKILFIVLIIGSMGCVSTGEKGNIQGLKEVSGVEYFKIEETLPFPIQEIETWEVVERHISRGIDIYQHPDYLYTQVLYRVSRHALFGCQCHQDYDRRQTWPR